MPIPLFASPWIATPLEELTNSAHTTVVAHVVDVAEAAPGNVATAVASAAGKRNVFRTPLKLHSQIDTIAAS
jgi:hypothetical protein